MNHYEQRQEEKREGLRAAAARRRETSSQLETEGRKALEAIPFGQPILVGHHSERGDRAYRGRAIGKIDKAYKLGSEANELEARADRIGTGGVSSDDPEAVAKLTGKLEELKKAHEQMLAVNKAYKAFLVEPKSLETSGLPERLQNIVRTYVPRYSWEKQPFVRFQLTNSSANIRRIQKRIEELRAKATAPAFGPFSGPGWLCEVLPEDNRVAFKFREIPSPELRSELKHRAFKWSPTRGLWVRQDTGTARFAAQQVVELLRAVDSRLLIS